MTNYGTGWTFDKNGLQGTAAGPTGQFAGVQRALGSQWGRMGVDALGGMLNGQSVGQSLGNAGLNYGRNEAMKYATKHLLGGALGGQAAGFLGGPYGMVAMAALPYLGKGISSLGRSLGIGGRKSGPSAQDLAMGETKSNLAGMRGSYGADMGTGKSMLDKYNPMLEDQIGKLQDLANRGLSTEYNTRQMAGAAATTEAARRAAEARMKATSGMIGGGQAVSGFGGINQAAVGGIAQGAYNAAQTNMNSQPGYINQLSGMIGNQINRGQGLFNAGRQGMIGLDQTLYNLNAQEKARADANAQANRTREAQMISGVANLAGTAAGMEQSRKQNRDIMNLLYGNGNQTTNNSSNPSGSVPPNLSFENTPTNPDGSFQVLPPNYEGSSSVVPYQPDNRHLDGNYDPERDSQNYDPNINAANSRSTPDYFNAQQFGQQFTTPPQMSAGDYPAFLQQLFRGNSMQDVPWEGSRSVTPMSTYMGDGYTNGRYDPDFYAAQGQGGVNPRNSAQNAQYVQQVIRQMFGGR